MIKKSQPCFGILLLIHLLPLLPMPAGAALHFDPAMLGRGGDIANLSAFEGGATLNPGRYPVDIYVNDVKVGHRELDFSISGSTAAEHHDNSGLRACLTRDDLTRYGVRVAAFPALQAMGVGECVSPGEYIPDAFMTFDTGTMRLDISIPQAAMVHHAEDWTDPASWDEGINAALLGWQLSGSHNNGRYGNSQSMFLNMRSGLNLGAWRLRSNSTWSRSESRYQHLNQWREVSSYAERDIIPLSSELTMGDSTSDDAIFDAFYFRGFRMATSDSMYPDSQTGYAPEIKGVADSNAEVSVRQNGNIIYRTYVAPGAFVIDDLYAPGSAGELTVSIKELNGTVHVYTVPYSSIPVLQRSGRFRYSLTAGRYRSAGDYTDTPAFMQGTLQWGLPHGVTLYGGLMQAQKYQAFAAGAGLNLGELGAVSADVTQADSVLPDNSRHQGQSVRFLYSRSLLSTGTTFQLIGYRYSTQDFHSFSDTTVKAMSGWYDYDTQVDSAGRVLPPDWHNYYNLLSKRRRKVTLNLSQTLGGYGAAYIIASQQTYWQSSDRTESFEVGFSNTFHQVSYNLSWNYSRFSGQPESDRMFWLGLSFPLGNSSGRTNMNLSASRDAQGNLLYQTGVSGTVADGSLLWAASQGSGRKDGASGDASLEYTARVGSLSAGYGYSRNYRQVRYGASGGIVLHDGGLTFGQKLGDTLVLVETPGAEGVRVIDQNNVYTDSMGFAVIPYTSKYRRNEVGLDVSSLDKYTDIDDPIISVIPTQGAVVRARFHTRRGVRALLTLMHNGKPLPLGTSVVASNGSAGLVGDNGEVYLSGLAVRSSIKAQWGRASAEQCVTETDLSAQPQAALLVRQTLNCR